MLRILIADDHEIVRRGVRDLIEAHADWEVCGDAADGQQALDLALANTPDIAILDISMPLLNGIVLTRRLRQERPSIRVLLYTVHEDEETVTSGLSAGARGYLLKTDSEQQLEAAISALGANRPFFSNIVSQVLIKSMIYEHRRGPLETFTVRELEVAQLIAEGNVNKQVARRLGISVKTVESHRAAAMRKAGVHTGAEFVRFAIRHNLIQA